MKEPQTDFSALLRQRGPWSLKATAPLLCVFCACPRSGCTWPRPVHQHRGFSDVGFKDCWCSACAFRWLIMNFTLWIVVSEMDCSTVSSRGGTSPALMVWLPLSARGMWTLHSLAPEHLPLTLFQCAGHASCPGYPRGLPQEHSGPLPHGMGQDLICDLICTTQAVADSSTPLVCENKLPGGRRELRLSCAISMSSWDF